MEREARLKEEHCQSRFSTAALEIVRVSWQGLAIPTIWTAPLFVQIVCLALTIFGFRPHICVDQSLHLCSDHTCDFLVVCRLCLCLRFLDCDGAPVAYHLPTACHTQHPDVRLQCHLFLKHLSAWPPSTHIARRAILFGCCCCNGILGHILATLAQVDVLIRCLYISIPTLCQCTRGDGW